MLGGGFKAGRVGKGEMGRGGRHGMGAGMVSWRKSGNLYYGNLIFKGDAYFFFFLVNLFIFLLTISNDFLDEVL